MAVARQLASIAQVAPGRLAFGVGACGEDRDEISNAGVDPATRGRRLDESLTVLHRLATGEPVDHDGEFFRLSGARVLPQPQPPIPVVIPGVGNAAVRRAAQHGDGWLAISARRFAATHAQIVRASTEGGRKAPDWFGFTV